MPPTIEFLGVIAVLAQTLSVVQAGETAVALALDDVRRVRHVGNQDRRELQTSAARDGALLAGQPDLRTKGPQLIGLRHSERSESLPFLRAQLRCHANLGGRTRGLQPLEQPDPVEQIPFRCTWITELPEQPDEDIVVRARSL